MPQSMNCSLPETSHFSLCKGTSLPAPLPRVHWTLSAPIKALTVNPKGASLLPQLQSLMGQGRWSCVHQSAAPPSKDCSHAASPLTATPFCAPHRKPFRDGPLLPATSCCPSSPAQLAVSNNHCRAEGASSSYFSFESNSTITRVWFGGTTLI